MSAEREAEDGEGRASGGKEAGEGDGGGEAWKEGRGDRRELDNRLGGRNGTIRPLGTSGTSNMTFPASSPQIQNPSSDLVPGACIPSLT